MRKPAISMIGFCAYTVKRIVDPLASGPLPRVSAEFLRCNFALHPDSDCARVRHWQPAWGTGSSLRYHAPAAGSVMNDDDVVERLIRFNRDREPERLKIKLKNMAADPFAFFRGTCHLFYEDWPAGNTELDQAPAVWVCGDLHLENFGSYKGDNRLTYFDINDFDESTLAPLTWDVTRLVTSLRLASKLYGLETETLRMLEKTCLAAYGEALAAGKPRWIERQAAKGLIGRLLLKVGTRKRKAFLDLRTELV